ncbi:unnamed protein product, partial [Prorocentrum cordatum]
SFTTSGTVLAGRACATTVAKLPVLAALRAASAGGRPLVVARNVVEDIALQAVGTERLVAAQLGAAGLEVACILRSQHLPISAAKTTFLASSPSLGLQLGEFWKSQGWTFRKTLQARNLGTDATITRRGVHEGRVRVAGALRRARRLGCLRAAGVEVDLIHKAGPAASMVWGRTVTGIADGELHSWRLAACRSAGAPPMGAALGLRMRCAELRRRRDLDPAAGHAVQMPASLLQSAELLHRMMARGLEAAVARHAAADTPWKHCASPIDAAVLTLARIGWHFKSERYLVTDLGDELDLLLLGPRELGLEASLGARRASDRREMRKLSHDPLLQRPLYWDAIGRLLGPDSELNARGQNALGAYVSNTHWTQGRRTDATWAQWVSRPADEKLNGKLYLDGSALEPQFSALRRAGWAIAQCDDDGNLAAGVYGTVRRDLCPQQAAKDGEAVLGGRLTEAQRRGNEHADRLAKMGALMHAVDRHTAGEHHALAEIVLELGRWISRAAILWQDIAAKDCEGLPPAAERRQVRFAAAEASQAAEGAASLAPSAKRPRLESARSASSSTAALSASVAAFSILGHALAYACTGEGDGTQELVACTKCGAYMTLGSRSRSGVRPRLKEHCPGDKADKGIPALRSQWPLPDHAQEQYLEWLGIVAGPEIGPSAAASSAGSASAAAAAPAEVRGPVLAVAVAPAAAADASLPLRRPAAARAALLGAFGVAENELAAAAMAAVGALE